MSWCRVYDFFFCVPTFFQNCISPIHFLKIQASLQFPMLFLSTTLFNYAFLHFYLSKMWASFWLLVLCFYSVSFSIDFILLSFSKSTCITLTFDVPFSNNLFLSPSFYSFKNSPTYNENLSVFHWLLSWKLNEPHNAFNK